MVAVGWSRRGDARVFFSMNGYGLVGSKGQRSIGGSVLRNIVFACIVGLIWGWIQLPAIAADVECPWAGAATIDAHAEKNQIVVNEYFFDLSDPLHEARFEQILIRCNAQEAVWDFRNWRQKRRYRYLSLYAAAALKQLKRELEYSLSESTPPAGPVSPHTQSVMVDDDGLMGTISNLDRKTGFRGLPWGSHPPATMDQISLAPHGVRAMVRDGDDLNLGQYDLSGLQYIYLGERLFGVRIEVPKSSAGGVLDVLRQAYGEPPQKIGSPGSWLWPSHSLHLGYEIVAGTGVAVVTFTHQGLYAEYLEAAEESNRGAVNDL